MSRRSIYCDYNATAPIRPAAKQAVLEAMECVGNPSSVHRFGRDAKRLVENARQSIGDAIGACRDDIVFTSGGTESNAFIIQGAMRADPSLQLIISAVEHDAVRQQVPDAMIAPVTPDGVMDLEWLKSTLAAWPDDGGKPFLALMLANNETGIIQPVAAAAELIHAHGGLIHCDAVQALGKIPVSVIDLDVDYLALSSHKTGGPKGVGAVYIKPGAPNAPLYAGGGQESRRRSGTENVAGIAGFGAAVSQVMNLDDVESVRAVRDAFEAQLNRLGADVKIFGANVERLPNTSNIALEGFRAETQVMALDLEGVAVSSGAACSSGKVKQSHVLSAMGVSEDTAASAVRFSFGWGNSVDDANYAAAAWVKCAERTGLLKANANQETA